MKPSCCPTSEQMQPTRDIANEWKMAIFHGIKLIKPYMRIRDTMRLVDFFVDITGYYMINDPPRLKALNAFYDCVRKDEIFIHPELEVPSFTLEGWKKFIQEYKKEVSK